MPIMQSRKRQKPSRICSRKRNKKTTEFAIKAGTELIAIDTETTGPDFFHGCYPFLLTLSTDKDQVHHWEWDVNPHTRIPTIPKKDLLEIQNLLNIPDVRFVFQNAKFDMRAMETIGLDIPPWELIEDTLIASHLMASSESHGLKDMALYYLDIPDDDEQELKLAIQKCQTIAKRLGWDIARKGHPTFPTISKTEWWKLDMWLPRALANHGHLNPKDPIVQTPIRYGRMDAIRTLSLWEMFFVALDDENLLPQYRERVHLIRVVDSMENRGMSLSQKKLEALTERFTKKLHGAKSRLINNSEGIVKNPNSPVQLAKLLYEYHGLPIILRGKSGVPSTSKEVIEKIQDEYAVPSDTAACLETISEYRKLKKCVENIGSYVHGTQNNDHKDWYTLHTEVNITGTRTTRFSCRSPNAQNISKKEGYNLREIFGPIPGREWYAIDYSNIEMRIFAYECEDSKLIQAFESGHAVHLIFAEILHPKEYAECQRKGISFKNKYKSTIYQDTKNGNYSLIYGASAKRADATYHVHGGYDLIRKHLPKIDSFLQKKYREGLRKGYVTLLGGYRLQVPRTDPHKSCNYFIQGSAGWAINRAMNRVYRYLRNYPDYHMIMQVHDELLFDFPKHPRNSTVIKHVAKLMEKSGTDIGIPLPVEVDLIPEDWAHGIEFN